MNQQPIYVFAQWQVKEGQLENVLNLLTKVARESRMEEGNLFYHIHQSNTDKNLLLLSEAYKDEQALAAHRNSNHFQQIVIDRIVPLLQNREVVLTSRILEDD